MDGVIPKMVLAVDGGGTGCRLALAMGERRQVVAVGPANVATDFDGAVARLTEGLARLASEAGLPAQALHAFPAHLGLAGVVGDGVALRLSRALPLTDATISDDRLTTVRGALGEADGALAGLGTGSFFGRQAGGAVRLVGGWGWRLGDGASGYWIGREALAATLDACDGLTPETALTRALLARFRSAPDLVAFGFAATPAEIAALAPQVAEAAGDGDPVGRRILGEAAAHVAGQLKALGWQGGEALCLVGGVAAAIREFLPDEVRAAVAEPRGSALDGALALARERAETGRGA